MPCDSKGDIDMFENSAIRIKRKGQYQGFLSKFKVFVDDKQVGRIKDDQTFEFRVEPGLHTIYIKPGFDWARSRKLTLDLAPGQVADLDCGNRNGFWPVLLPLLTPLIRYYSPSGKENLFVYCFFGLAVVLYLAASLKPSFFVYLTEVE